VSIFGFHICWQEIQMFIMSLPVVGLCWICFKNWVKGRKNNGHPHGRKEGK
jgi:hypothetical protein